jgi:membrane dipeptidase
VKRRRQIGRILRLVLSATIILSILIGIIGFLFGPSLVAKRFNPVNNLAAKPLSPASQALHQSLTIADLHADSLLWGRDLSKLSSYGHVDVPRLLQGNVALQTFTVVTKVPAPLLLEGNSDRSDDITKLAILQRWPIPSWFSLKERALYQAKRLQTLEQKASGTFKIIKTKQDLNNYLAQRQQNQAITAGLLGLEGAQALEGKIENLNQLYEAGFRLIGLAHFFDNEVSGSIHGIHQGGLTPFGQEVLKRIEDLGLIIDLAHASSQTLDEVLQITHCPVLVSHTGVQGTCNNARNLSDRQLKQIAQADGIIGIGFWKTAVCGEDVSAIVRAIRYVVEQVGVDHVALGSDFDGAVRMPFDGANLGQITEALQKEGFTEIDIRKMMGLNVIRLLQQVLPA